MHNKSCTELQSYNGTCDGTLADCWKQGKRICDDLGSPCYGVRVHSNWSSIHKGFKLCTNASTDGTDDGWMTALKTSNLFVFEINIKIL